MITRVKCVNLLMSVKLSRCCRGVEEKQQTLWQLPGLINEWIRMNQMIFTIRLFSHLRRLNKNKCKHHLLGSNIIFTSDDSVISGTSKPTDYRVSRLSWYSAVNDVPRSYLGKVKFDQTFRHFKPSFDHTFIWEKRMKTNKQTTNKSKQNHITLLY